MLPALGSAFCGLTDKTRGTTGYGHCVLHLPISQTRQKQRFLTSIGIGFCIRQYHTRDRGFDLTRALGSVFGEITHETGGTICYGRFLHLVISLTNKGYDVLRALGSASCDIPEETAGVRFVTSIGFCLLCHHTRDTRYDLYQKLSSASCETTNETGVRFVTGIGFCI